MQPARRRLLALALGSAVAGPACLQAGAARAQSNGALVLEPEGRLQAAPLFATVGAVLFAGPLPIVGGSGSPCRALALVERR